MLEATERRSKTGRPYPLLFTSAVNKRVYKQIHVRNDVCSVDMPKKRDKRITFGQDFISSAVAGFASKTLTAPFDVIKIRSQIGTPESRFGYLKNISNLFNRDGLRGFWKGNLTGCLRLVPQSTIQLIAFSRLRMILADNSGRIDPYSAFIAAAGSGLLANVATYPMDVMKTRLIAQHGNPKWAHYKGISHSFRTVIKNEGFHALYKGLSASLLGNTISDNNCHPD